MKHTLTLAALVFATSCFGQEACPNVHDINSNGTIDIEDFLSILGLFADVDVDGDGVWDSQDDCVDATACNYLASPTEPCGYLDALGECGGACEGDGDGDGICDDEDDCVGVVDECGVCNGPGPTQVVVEDVVFTYDSIFLPIENEWFVFAVDADTTFNFLCFPACGDPVSYQGYDYETVQIGDQCWFAENLRSVKYRNGDSLLTNLTLEEWDDAVEGVTAFFGEGDLPCTSSSPLGNSCNAEGQFSQFGQLYNWYAVDDSRSLCPNGWHVPSDDEFIELADQFGGYEVAGLELKSTMGWNQAGGTNSSGFNAVPSGVLYWFLGFAHDGDVAYFWSSTPAGSGSAKFRSLSSSGDGFIRYNSSLKTGKSVRCIQDSE